jgi:hypothetical protein
VVFPFSSFKNFFKTGVWMFMACYVMFSSVVMLDYLGKQYGGFDKVFCDYGTKSKLQKSVVRIIGGYSEGSGFFISPHEVVTNFHVIEGEVSPKVVFPNGKFETPEKIVGESDMDIAVLTLAKPFYDEIYDLPLRLSILEDEPLFAAGYPLGSDITGKATVVKGNFVDFRRNKKDVVGYVQTNISLVQGMSGGPIVDQCGSVVGINTMGLAGLSFFIRADDVRMSLNKLTSKEVEKIEVNPSKSPEEAVRAFYTYLKARRMTDGFNLLSENYLQKTDIAEWTARFTDILDVRVYKVEKFENSKDTVFVKFATKNWNDGELVIHYYEGTWQTVLEDGVYKMDRSKIVEIEEPGLEWFWE